MNHKDENRYILNEKTIFLNLDAKDREDAFGLISKVLLEEEIVKDTFLEALNKRENEFATGLQGNKFGIAIPHTDAEHVNRQSISVAVLAEPLDFIHMGTEDQIVKVDIIFTLAIKDPSDQLEMLQKLMGLIQNDDLLSKIKHSEDRKEILTIVEEQLLNY